MATTLTVFKHL